MSKLNNTSVSVWLAMPLTEFCCWLETSNELVREEREAIEKARRKRG